MKPHEIYQCPGCAVYCDGDDCFTGNFDCLACINHVPGTSMSTGYGLISLFLGMPTGFNRRGTRDLNINIFDSKANTQRFDHLNIPVWKHLDEHGNTLVRGYSPRIDKSFLYVILGNCIDQIDCFEIEKEHIEGME